MANLRVVSWRMVGAAEYDSFQYGWVDNDLPTQGTGYMLRATRRGRSHYFFTQHSYEDFGGWPVAISQMLFWEDEFAFHFPEFSPAHTSYVYFSSERIRLIMARRNGGIVDDFLSRLTPGFVRRRPNGMYVGPYL